MEVLTTETREFIFTHDDELWINQQIEESVSNRPPKPTPPPSENWVKRNMYWLPWATGLLFLGIGYFSGFFDMVIDKRVRTTLTAELDYRLEERLPYNLKERYSALEAKVDSIDDRLGRIEAILDRLTTLKDIAQYDPKVFANSLPQLRRIISDPHPKVDQSTVKAIARKLSGVSTDTPEYWPTLLEFIKFASLSRNPAPPIGPKVVFRESIVNGSDEGLGEFSETIGGNFKVVELEGGRLTNVILRNYHIVFTKNPVQMENVLFVNCTFEIPVSLEQNPYIREAARQLVASQFEKIAEVRG